MHRRLPVTLRSADVQKNKQTCDSFFIQSIYRNRFQFPAHFFSFWSGCWSLFWSGVSRDVFGGDYMFTTRVLTNTSVIKLLSPESGMFAYVELCVCVCVYSMYVQCLSVALQWDAATIKEPIWRAALPPARHSVAAPHTAVQIHEFDYI